MAFAVCFDIKRKILKFTTKSVSVHTWTRMSCRQITLLAVVSWACVAQRWDTERSRKCVSHEGMCLCWLQPPITSQRENRHQRRSVCSPARSFPSEKPPASTPSFLTSASAGSRSLLQLSPFIYYPRLHLSIITAEGWKKKEDNLSIRHSIIEAGQDLKVTENHLFVYFFPPHFLWTSRDRKLR